MTVQEALVHGIRSLKAAGVDSPQLDCAVLLAHALGITRERVYVEAGREVDPARLLLFQQMLQRRVGREPVQYITGTREFMGLEFEVGPGVLVPRPETEVLVEVAQRLIKNSGRWPYTWVPDYANGCAPPDGYLLADIGTGSGAIAVTLAWFLISVITEGKGALPAPSGEAIPGRAERYPWSSRVFATDISSEALEIAKRNAARHHVRGTIEFLQGDMWQPLESLGLAGRLDAVVSNPPYISTAEMETLQPEVRLFEPRQALDGGEDGLYYYRILASGAPKFLRPGGFLALEVGVSQSQAVRALMEASGLRNCQTANDLQGIPRVVYGFRA